MGLGPSLSIRQTQALVLTPQLQQAIRLLQMPAIELQAHLSELLESNVMLEAVDEGEADGSPLEGLPEGLADAAPGNGDPAESADRRDDDTPEVEILEDAWDDRSTGSGESSFDDDDRQRDIADNEGRSLREHLLAQLELAGLSPHDLAIASAIVDAINDDGYVTDGLAEIASTLRPELDCAEDEVERVLMLVQMLDPAGVGARTLSECFLLQLGQLEAGTPGLELARRIAADHLERLAQRDLSLLRAALGADEDALAAAVALVRGCHPRPGSAVSSAAPEYVVPDLLVRRTDRGWSVEVNPATAPRVRVNEGYASLIGRGTAHTTMRTQLQEARWLLKSLEIRHDTMLKVGRAIVERQAEFLEHGEERMRPMILKDIAEAIAMHESTISRVTSGKFMLTPRGVFELRFFFSSQVEGGDGQGTSSTAIRAKIRKLVREENATAPLSDARIAEILSGEGIPVARRTVAKYREALGIAPSQERKRPETG